jgi:hypothetical protein
MTLDAAEFLRRFFLHVLPRGFVRIRHYGLLANRFRNQHLKLARALMALDHNNPPLWHCPMCGGPMRVVCRLDPMEINSS